MKESYVDDRKAYVERVRQSFHASNGAEHQRRNARYEDDYDDYEFEAEPIGFSFFKGRIIIAVFLFLMFCFLHITGQSILDHSSKDLVKQIEKNYSLKEVTETIWNLVPVFQDDTEKY